MLILVNKSFLTSFNPLICCSLQAAMEEGAHSKHFIETVTDYVPSSFSHP
jgi:hypothetical protein